MEVRLRTGTQVPDDNTGRRKALTRTPHILTGAFERFLNHLDVRLPGRRLDNMAVSVAGVVTDPIRGTRRVPPHVRKNDEVLRLLPWTHTLRLERLEHKVHRLLEIRAGSLTASAFTNCANPRKQVRARRKVVPCGIGVKGHQLVLELVGADLRAKNAERHADPVGRAIH